MPFSNTDDKALYKTRTWIKRDKEKNKNIDKKKGIYSLFFAIFQIK